MTTAQSEPLKCANHPNRDTLLRCNRCEKPICVECAVLTPTGYRCKECVRSQQKIFDTALPKDYVYGIIVAGILSFIGSLLVGLVGFFVIFLAPAAGWVISEAVRKATGRRRGKLLFRLIAAATVLGALVNLLPILLMLLLGNFSIGILLAAIWPAVYAFIVSTTVYYRLSGIQIK
jgi:phosphoglycerol transferase MdoB-like AlkP superfamily enzyme